MVTKQLLIPVLGFCIASFAGCSPAGIDASEGRASADDRGQLTDNTERKSKIVGDPYPLATCPVTGAILGTMGEPVTIQAYGREIRFCCEACPDQFDSNPNYYRAKIDEVILEQQLPVYPTDDCVVSDRHLGSMGTPVEYVIGNRLIRMCCDCQETLKDDLDNFMAKLDRAVVHSQQATYPMDVCIVSGEELGGAHGEIIGAVIANRLFQLCCKNCVEELRREPAKHIKILDSARMAAASGEAMPSPLGQGHDPSQPEVD